MNIIKHGTVYGGCGIFAYNAWPSVITLTDGSLLAAWSGDRYRHICPFGRVLAARSFDGGYTWQPPYTVQNTPLDDRDAGLCAAGGKILLTSFNNSRAQQRFYMETKKWNNVSPALIEGYLCEISDEVFCYGLGDHFGILSDGTVIPCCLDSDGVIALGNVFDTPIDKILSSERAVKIREGFKKRLGTEDLCKRCGYATRFIKK
jgi:radical SAM protein with 4Fe4S-binding SPASM domain